MEKVYRLLPWLNTRQAVEWLKDMTATPLTERELLQLCGAKHCAIYIIATGLEGFYFDAEGSDQKCIGIGYQKVLSRVLGAHEQHFQLEGKYEPIGSELWPEEGYWEAITEIGAGYGIYFKPADIQALAAKMNGQPEQLNIGELEELRQQLEQERAAREAAETELLKRRAEDGKRTLDNMRHMLMHDHKEFAAMQERAEQAERMVATLDRQVIELTESRQLDNKIFKEMTRQLSECLGGRQPDITLEASSTGLIFPYATKELEAMRAAVAKYWEGYTTDKRQPTQKEVAIEIGELLGLSLMKNNDPARKAVNLAAAIKPNDLPDA